jgi:signal transduction histidine kinase
MSNETAHNGAGAHSPANARDSQRRSRGFTYALRDGMHSSTAVPAPSLLHTVSMPPISAARVGERTRIARELHDTLLQGFHGLLLRFQTASYLLPDRPAEAKEKLDGAIAHAAKAITEGRDAVQGLRASTVERNDLAVAIRTLGDELATDASANPPPTFCVGVEGQPRDLHPILRGEVDRIAAEALRNA